MPDVVICPNCKAPKKGIRSHGSTHCSHGVRLSQHCCDCVINLKTKIGHDK